MSEKTFKRLVHEEARRRAKADIDAAPDGWIAETRPPTRSLEQNSAQWPILEAFSKQQQWPVNGQMVFMEPDEWKQVLSAAFRQETARLAMGLNGGVVMLGARTSKFNKPEFSDWLEFLHAVAAQRGVKLSA